MSTLYLNKPDGLCGNDDMGQMSAWYVFSALGFFTVKPADGRYVFGTPQFEEIKLNLPDLKTFVVSAKNLSDENIYISKALFNGNDYSKGYFTRRILMEGGTLEFEMTDMR